MLELDFPSGLKNELQTYNFHVIRKLRKYVAQGNALASNYTFEESILFIITAQMSNEFIAHCG